MILIDTSAWVRFFKGLDEAAFVSERVRDNSAVLHPLVLGELLLGGLSEPNRSLLEALTSCRVDGPEAVYHFIRDRKVSGRGVGWVDAVILCSVTASGAELATFDTALRSDAGELGVRCVPEV